MHTSESFIGIDVSKDSFDVHVHPSADAFSSPSDPRSISSLVARLRALDPTLIVLEATGGYERLLVTALAAAGLPIRPMFSSTVPLNSTVSCSRTPTCERSHVSAQSRASLESGEMHSAV